MKIRTLIVLMFAVAVASAGCAGTHSKRHESDAVGIAALLQDPGKYDDQTVTISGKVTGDASAFGQGAYTVDDGTGKITVLTSHNAPTKGSEVVVQGTFKSLYTIGSASGAVINEKERQSL